MTLVDRMEWRCSMCDHVANSSDDLLAHVWRAHAGHLFAVDVTGALRQALKDVAARRRAERARLVGPH